MRKYSKETEEIAVSTDTWRHFAWPMRKNENKMPYWHEKGARNVEIDAACANGIPEIVLASMDCENDCDE